MTRRVALLLAAGSLTACGAASSYMGIDLRAGDTPLQNTTRRAAVGDKQAQYELGLRFENGDGVARDVKRARHLYRLAASDSGGTMFVYSPPVGKQKLGTMIPISTPKVYGIPEARRRLAALKAE